MSFSLVRTVNTVIRLVKAVMVLLPIIVSAVLLNYFLRKLAALEVVPRDIILSNQLVYLAYILVVIASLGSTVPRVVQDFSCRVESVVQLVLSGNLSISEIFYVI